ncbi:hypothetical protein GCM10009760_22930 [Kitasatospora kazusensis]|uniref:Big-1 domain-containing protein n=1 Tax=Kitasatospora kazusensis TaxID=407974 RepID=A0ABP5L0L0_9ACTN
MRISRTHGLIALAVATAAVLPAAPLAAAAPAASSVSRASTYFSVSNYRVLDTRVGNGATGPSGPGSVVRLDIAKKLGLSNGTIPTAVVLNLTVVDPTAGTFVSAYPTGGERPTVSNVNVAPGPGVTTNRATVQVSKDGYVDVYNHAGTTDLVADIQGFYTGVGENGTLTGSTYIPGEPTRLLDTRTDTGGLPGKVGPGEQIVADVSGALNPDTTDTDLVLQLTATNASAPSFVTAYAATLNYLPNTSDLNFAAGQSVTNLAFVDVDKKGLALYNHSGSTDLVMDYVGAFEHHRDAGSPGASGLFLPAAPTRVLDTRSGNGAPATRVGADQAIRVKVSDLPGAPAPDKLGAVVLNLTATNASEGSYVTAYAADGSPRPGTSNLNFTAGRNTAAMAIVPVSQDGYVNLYNHSGSVDLIADVQGYYTY